MLDHLGLEPVVPNAGELLSGRYPILTETGNADLAN
jgi:hypothetical protein